MNDRRMQAEVIVAESPMTGRFNMAMDAALLELGATRDVAVIRIYRWSEPTVSVGYFQGATEPIDSPFPGLPVVRRLSGGGAILHDCELTYSCVLPMSHPLRLEPSELYGVIHRRVIELLQQCGVRCSLRSHYDAVGLTPHEETPATNTARNSRSTEAFLCFQRRNPNDIVHASGIKIVGSAQRRRRGVTLQHGSILLGVSPITPEVLGIHQLCPHFDEGTFTAAIPEIIANSVCDRFQIRSFSAEELAAADKFLSEEQSCRDASQH